MTDEENKEEPDREEDKEGGEGRPKLLLNLFSSRFIRQLRKSNRNRGFQTGPVLVDRFNQTLDKEAKITTIDEFNLSFRMEVIASPLYEYGVWLRVWGLLLFDVSVSRIKRWWSSIGIDSKLYKLQTLDIKFQILDSKSQASEVTPPIFKLQTPNTTNVRLQASDHRS
ncbi:hypothetical protein WN48_00632 [Eufriesea mexicana]|uniref:Uncharacterized protein n=1 Tax=Eufriesea mexicana TaxID=516756 RepID=A0A310SGR6_9HYME|nr:hypothetical protein WN48_00632 [Eufriesea mexicana]